MWVKGVVELCERILHLNSVRLNAWYAPQVANWAVAFSFPVLLHVAREWAFLLFIATTSTFFFFTLCFVPETKNRSVPEITRIFQAMPMPLVGALDPPTLPK